MFTLSACRWWSLPTPVYWPRVNRRQQYVSILRGPAKHKKASRTTIKDELCYIMPDYDIIYIQRAQCRNWWFWLLLSLISSRFHDSDVATVAQFTSKKVNKYSNYQDADFNKLNEIALHQKDIKQKRYTQVFWMKPARHGGVGKERSAVRMDCMYVCLEGD